MKYYLHDSNSFNDEKITELYINFGYEGIGLFYTILEKLAQQEKPIKTEVLKHQLKIGKKLEKCWNFMESLGIISSNNGETFNKQLLNYSEKYKIKKEKNNKRISEWREKQEVTENATRYEQPCNAPKVNRSKVNKIEVNNIDNIRTDFIPIVEKWIEYKTDRKELFKSVKSLNCFYKLLLKLSNSDPVIANEIIEQSMANNWQGIFELKTSKKQEYGKSIFAKR